MSLVTPEHQVDEPAIPQPLFKTWSQGPYGHLDTDPSDLEAWHPPSSAWLADIPGPEPAAQPQLPESAPRSPSRMVRLGSAVLRAAGYLRPRNRTVQDPSPRSWEVMSDEERSAWERPQPPNSPTGPGVAQGVEPVARPGLKEIFNGPETPRMLPARSASGDGDFLATDIPVLAGMLESDSGAAYQVSSNDETLAAEPSEGGSHIGPYYLRTPLSGPHVLRPDVGTPIADEIADAARQPVGVGAPQGNDGGHIYH